MPAGVWHSPLRRAADTAREIARAQSGSVAMQAAEELTEIAQGEWEGLAHADVRTRWEAQLAAWRRSPLTDHAPGGESLPDAALRVAAAIEQVVVALRGTGGDEVRPSADVAGDVASLRHDPVPGYPTTNPERAPDEPWAVLVAHDGIFRLALMTLLDIPLERFWSFPFNLCAISVVAVNDGVPALRAHNLSEHLSPLAVEAQAAEEARGDRRGAL
jgi:broad specificity phosphatase PhoE